MQGKKKHIVWILSNASSAPYFNWFAKLAAEKKDFDMTFICMYHEPPQMTQEIQQFGFQTHWVKYDWRKRKRGMLRSYFAMKKLLKKIKPDIVHAHLFDDALTALRAAKNAGVPVRIATKGDASYHFFHKPFYLRFDKYINRVSTTVIALSEESRRYIIDKEQCPPEKVKLVHHGLDIPSVTAQHQETTEGFRTRWNLHGKTVVGSVSRFIPWKGYARIVEVAAAVVARRPDVIFLFCGSGEQQDEIKSAVGSAGIQNNVIFTGSIASKDMPSFYAAMNIFLHAAHFEPFGLVIAEAMLNGTPVVSTRTGAAADAVISGEHGYLCDYGDIPAMTEAILKLTDSELAQTMGRKCISRATELFSIETGYENHLKIYQQE